MSDDEDGANNEDETPVAHGAQADSVEQPNE